MMAPTQAGRVVKLVLAFAIGCCGQASDLIEPFPFSAVKLTPNSDFDKAQSLNVEYMLSLDEDDLLRTFRENARLPAPGMPYSGSWEDSGCEVRGQFMGHYLSALAFLANHTGNGEILSRSIFLTQELHKVQLALGAGYLSAFPAEHFERLQLLQPVWAPFYVIHKIMAGLLDLYTFTGNHEALDMAHSEALYFDKYTENILAGMGRDHWLAMLNVEFGGMQEVLANLYTVTGDPRVLRLSGHFVKPLWYVPLRDGHDPLPGMHANTHLAQVNGFVAGYEATGLEGYGKAVVTFFEKLTQHHSYVTGGSNQGESWGPADNVADAITDPGRALFTEETCTQYNVLKVARALFRHTGHARLADLYETAILNGILGTQRMPAGYTSKPYHGSGQLSAPPQRLSASSPPGQRLGQGGGTLALPGWGAPLVENLNSSWSQQPVQRADWRAEAMRRFPGPQASLGQALLQKLGQLWAWGMGQVLPLQAQGQLGDGGSSQAPGPGVLLYFQALGTGQHKGQGQGNGGWGTPLHSFWCCYGSGVESMAKLADSIFFWRWDRSDAHSAPELFVNQLAPAVLTWQEQGLKLSMASDMFAPDMTARARLSFTWLGNHTHGAHVVALKMRAPGWAIPGKTSGKLNKKHMDTHADKDGYIAVTHAFGEGDELDFSFPMKVVTEHIQDDRPQFRNLRAVKMGPYVMAGLTRNSSIALNPAKIADAVSDVEESLVLVQQGNSYLQVVDGRFAAADLPSELIELQSFLFQCPKPGDAVAWHESIHMPGRYLVCTTKGWELKRQNEAAWLASSREDVQECKGEAVQMQPLSSTGRLPQGTKLLKAAGSSFLIAPLGHLRDETYSIYFNFRH